MFKLKRLVIVAMAALMLSAGSVNAFAAGRGVSAGHCRNGGNVCQFICINGKTAPMDGTGMQYGKTDVQKTETVSVSDTWDCPNGNSNCPNGGYCDGSCYASVSDTWSCPNGNSNCPNGGYCDGSCYASGGESQSGSGHHGGGHGGHHG